jgi:hypothetical protein
MRMHSAHACVGAWLQAVEQTKVQTKSRLVPALHVALEHRQDDIVGLLLSATTEMGWGVVRQRLVESFCVGGSSQVSDRQGKELLWSAVLSALCEMHGSTRCKQVPHQMPSLHQCTCIIVEHESDSPTTCVWLCCGCRRALLRSMCCCPPTLSSQSCQSWTGCWRLHSGLRC